MLYTVCNVRWLGLRPTQIQQLDTIDQYGEHLSIRDEKLIHTLRHRMHHISEYIRELDVLQQVGKHELQWLYGHEEGVQFLSQTWLPRAILRGDYI